MPAAAKLRTLLPGRLPARVANQILAFLDLSVKQSTSFATNGDRVVVQVAHAIGLAVADESPL